MMKKLLLTMLGVLMALPTIARDFDYTYEGQTLTYTVISEEDKTVKTKDGSVYGSLRPGNSVSGTLIIPATVKDGNTEYRVTEIGQFAFQNCSGLTSVTIPNSVTSIGGYAFRNCSGLTSVTIGNSVTSIGESVFYGCSGLTSVIIPNSVTSIGEYVFYGCSGLTSVIIPNSVTSIGKSAFKNCSGLTSVTIGNSVTSIGEYAFMNCSGLTSLTIGNSVTSIGESAFEDCSGLTSVTIPNSVTSIGEFTFKNCSGLTSVTIPNSVTSIGKEAFLYCSGLTKAEFASIESLCTIEFGNYSSNPLDYAHHLYIDGKEIADLIIPESVTSIGKYAFLDCSGLTSVTIPNSVTSIGKEAFHYCSGLTKAEFASIESLCSIEFGNYWSNPLYYAHHLYIDGKEITDLIIPESVTSIGKYAFLDCSGLTSVTIPNSVTSIGEYAFMTCSGLTSVTIPNSVTSIGYYAFEGCRGLTKAEFASIESLCSIKFSNSYSNPLFYAHHLYIDGKEITDLIIPESVTSIGNYAFSRCSGLTSVTIPNSVTSIGNYAFSECSGLTEVNVSWEKPVTIASNTFSNDTYSTATLSLNKKSIIEYLESTWWNFKNRKADGYAIKNYTDDVFNYLLICNPDNLQAILVSPNNSKITTVNIPARFTDLTDEANPVRYYVTAIGSYAFKDCENLTEVLFHPNSIVSNIGREAFYNCSGLTSLTIPNSVTSIGDYAFSCCSSLTDVTLLDGDVIEFGQEVFRDTNIKNAYIGRPLTKQVLPLSNLETLTIGNTVTEIGASMWKDASNLKTLTLGSSLTTIGDEAFSGCTSLTEVVVPPSVETIGASAFAGDTKLASIIMGHSVKTIGGKAYDGCPANTVSITAPTPPTAPNNTFSNYNGKLYLQGPSAVQAYYDAYTCWDRFNGYVMIEPTEIKYDGDTKIEGKPGDTFQLKATLMPENVTLSQLFWRSTNPDIATVDENGLVTLHADLNDVMTMADRADSGSCKIIAESLYVDGPVLEVDVTSTMNGIEDILVNKPAETTTIDYTSPYDVYNLSGAWVGNSLESLSNGFYIVRQGNVAKKVAIK